MGDDNKVLLWNLERPKAETKILIDSKSSADHFQITSTKFHESKSLFMYTTSQGHVRLCDMRESSNFDRRCSVEFKYQPRGPANIFSKQLSAIHEAKFVPNSNYIAARDYLSVKLWDMRNTESSKDVSGLQVQSKPVYSARVNDYFDTSLVELYERDNLSDKFFIGLSPSGKHLATGGYNKSFNVMDLHATTNQQIVCNFNDQCGLSSKSVGVTRHYKANKRLEKNTSVSINASKQVGVGCWRPTESKPANSLDTLAVAYRSCIYLY